jgi:hypothetical protein
MDLKHVDIGLAYLLKAIDISPDGRSRSGLPLKEIELALDHFAIAAFKQGCHPLSNWAELAQNVINKPYGEWPSYLQERDLLRETDRLIQFGNIPDKSIRANSWVSELANDGENIALRNCPEEIEENQFFNELCSYCQSQNDPQGLYVKLRRYLVSSVSKTEDEMIDFLVDKPKTLRNLIDKAYYIANTATSKFACQRCGAPSMESKPHPECRDCTSTQPIQVRKYEQGEKVLRGRICSAFYFRGAIDVALFEELKKIVPNCQLWPNLDADGDVAVNFSNGECWIFDCKDYLYPRALIRKVRKEQVSENGDRFVYVVPDRVGEVYLQQIKDALPDRTFLSFRQAIKSVKNKARKTSHART